MNEKNCRVVFQEANGAKESGNELGKEIKNMNNLKEYVRNKNTDYKKRISLFLLGGGL